MSGEGLDVGRLRAVAEAAATITSLAAVIGGDRWRLDGWPEEATAFIAEVDPPTVLALLDRVAELEAQVARVEALADSWARLDSGQPEWCRRAGLKVRAALAGESDE